MELTLERIDLRQLQTTSRKSTRLLPKGKKRQQRVVAGDQTGSIFCFGMKKDSIEQVFKTEPREKEVSRLELGGKNSGDPEERDRIFFASGGIVLMSSTSS